LTVIVPSWATVSRVVQVLLLIIIVVIIIIILPTGVLSGVCIRSYVPYTIII